MRKLGNDKAVVFRNVLSLVALLLSCIGKAEEAPAQRAPEQEEMALRLAEREGRLIYRHDRAAAVATDELIKMRGFKADRRMHGWVTRDSGDKMEVVFIGGPEGQPESALYRATVGEDGKLIGEAIALKTPEPLSAFEAAAAAARAIAMKADFMPCSKKYNRVVLPVGEDLDHWVVYLLPGTTKQNIVPIGGTYRLEVDIKTQKVTMRPYTRTCIELQNDSRTAALMVTHLLDPIPTEVHVFWSLWSGKPMYAATTSNGALWSVQGAQIRLVQRRAPEE